jgi:hypothetical protein
MLRCDFPDRVAVGAPSDSGVERRPCSPAEPSIHFPAAAMLVVVRRGGKNRASPEETNSTKASIGRMDQSVLRDRSCLAGAGFENEA